MATINGSTNKSVWTFKLVTTEGQPNAAKNTSPLTVDVYIGRSTTGGASYMYGADISCSVNVTGCTAQKITYKNANRVDIAAGAWLKIGSTTFGAVPHDSNGSKTVTVSASFTNTISPSSGSASGSVTLTNIARATTPTLSSTSVTMGTELTITVAPADSTYKHKFEYDFGDLKSQTIGLLEGIDFTPSGNRTIKFIPPVYLAEKIPKAMEGVCTLYCYTYTSSGVLIGSTSKTLTLKVPSYELITNVTISGNNLLNGEYVQGKSTVTVLMSANTNDFYGAEVNYSTTVDGKTHSGSKFTTSALSSGEKTISTVMTDSRGKKTTISPYKIVVREYFTPQITSFTVTRKSDGTTVVATVRGNVAPVNNKNSKSITVILNGETKTISASGYAIDGTVEFTNVNTDKSYTATAKITDHYTGVSVNAILPTVSVPLDFLYNNKGVAIGKVAETGNLLDVAWDVKSHGEFRSLEYSKLTGFKYLGVIDVNTVKTAGMYGVYNATNAPSTEIATLEVITYSPDWIIQRFTTVPSGITYIRRWHSGVAWSYWEKFETYSTLLSSTLNNSTTSATLSQTIANFQFIEVYFHDNDNLYDSIKIRNNYSANIKATIGHPVVGTYGYLKTVKLEINGTTATVSENKQIAVSTSFGATASSNGVVTSGNFIYVDSIVGVK